MATKKAPARYSYTGDSIAYISTLGRWVEPGETVESEDELVSGVLEPVTTPTPKDKE